MNAPIDQHELIEQYCLGLLDSEQQALVEQKLLQDPAFKNEVFEFQQLLNTLSYQEGSTFIHESLDRLHNQTRSNTNVLFHQLSLHVNRYWKTASVAASVAFVASILTFTVARSIYKKNERAQYQTLRNEINSIKKDQRQIEKEVDIVKKNHIVPVPNYPSKYSGTAFALNREGILVTNLHVVEGFSKIFVFTADNEGHACELLASDPENDLAILKINEDNFSFGNRVPYSLRANTPAVAQRVFSLGFPKNDVVYNEGYVSSLTGFEGDSQHYQLELPSGPGVSGAPVIDEQGNVIAVISGKQSQTNGVTFAVKSKSLLQLLKSVPKETPTVDLRNNTLSGLGRSAQVKKIAPYVCVVKVYN
jgi:S1-C subfamily serine protease